MALRIYQTINIHFIKIGSVTNSSVVQIGTTGSIQAQSDIYNTGGFIEPAEEAVEEVRVSGRREEILVPLSSI